MHAIAATEIFAVWEEIIISKGGDKVNLAEASCPRSTVLLARVSFIATKMKLYIPMRMCYVYAVVPQPCFIGQKTETLK